ncbi:hypothetical protein KFK09_000126 [Dendrobium nobile]|uniref:Uncharacterized protein n=1 Tax=Dendrobium nobile TaxID=94219 RepID=A0A8T3CB11_DENNO|nr:hypothetical protein KFK09_000126 [Dendrobium nobile]
MFSSRAATKRGKRCHARLGSVTTQQRDRCDGTAGGAAVTAGRLRRQFPRLNAHGELGQATRAALRAALPEQVDRFFESFSSFQGAEPNWKLNFQVSKNAIALHGN